MLSAIKFSAPGDLKKNKNIC